MGDTPIKDDLPFREHRHIEDPSAPNPTHLISSAGWTEESLVTHNVNFLHVSRIDANIPQEQLLAKIKQHEASGIPLIIQGWHKHPGWNTHLFAIETFVGDGAQEVEARNVRTAEDVRMPLHQLVAHYQEISDKALPDEHTRFYGKDIRCPVSWERWLKSGVLPAHIHPLGSEDMFSCLASEDQPETLMCYLGIGDTFTPAHKDLCASFGHNLMCHTAQDASAFWFMSATGDDDAPAAYFHDVLGAELDHESHTASVAELSRAPFPIYVAEQRLGDLVLVPPRSCHQVVNRGGVTIKMSWSRMGLKSFGLALHDELPLYHRVCRQEVYRVKLNVFHAVKEYARRLRASPLPSSPESRLPLSTCRDPSPAPLQRSEIARTLSILLELLDVILIQEWMPRHMELTHVSSERMLHTCDFCGADIFQSFFACSKCALEDQTDEFICCPACYVEGRACACEDRGVMVPRQSWPFDDLVRERDVAAEALLPERVPPWNANDTCHVRIFQAACQLYDHKIERAGMSRNKTHLRCTTRVEDPPAHDAPSTHVLSCSGCHAGMCFGHILTQYDVHAAEALLEPDWHTRHTNKRIVQTTRLASVAKTFRKCRPVDAARAREGFYDDFKLVDVVEEEPQAPPLDAAKEPVALLRADSPLTELSESESEEDSSDTDFDPSPSRKRAQPRKTVAAPRRHAPHDHGASSRLPETPEPESEDPMEEDVDLPSTPRKRASLPRAGAIRSKHRPYVLIPSKRRAAPDTASTTTPAKRARIAPTPRMSDPGPARRITDVDSTVPDLRRRNLTVVPVQPSPSSARQHRPQPATILRRARPAAAVAGKLPSGALVGHPSRNATVRRVPALPKPGTSKPGHAGPSMQRPSLSPGRVEPPPDVLQSTLRLLEEERKEKDNLQKQLNDAQARETALRIENAKLREELPVHQAQEMREQIRNLKAELAAVEDREAQAGQYARDLHARETDWQRRWEAQEEELRRLKDQAHDHRVAVADRDRGRIASELTAAAVISQTIVHGIGNAINQVQNSLQMTPWAPASHSSALMYAAPMQRVPITHGPMEGSSSSAFQQGPMRGRGSHSRYSGRGTGKRGIMAGGSRPPPSHHKFYSGKRSPEERRSDYNVPRAFDQLRGRPNRGEYQLRRRTPSRERRIVYERPSSYERQYDDERSSVVHNRQQYDDERSSVVHDRQQYDDERFSVVHDRQEYRDHHEDERERSPYTSPTSTHRVGQSGDGGWSNVRDGSPPSYVPDDHAVIRSPSRTRTVYSRSPSLPARGIEEPQSRQVSQGVRTPPQMQDELPLDGQEPDEIQQAGEVPRDELPDPSEKESASPSCARSDNPWVHS